MEIQLSETARGITVCLSVQIGAQALAHHTVASLACAAEWPELEQDLGAVMDTAHPKLLQMLRQARLEAERSLLSFQAQKLHEQWVED